MTPEKGRGYKDYLFPFLFKILFLEGKSERVILIKIY